LTPETLLTVVNVGGLVLAFALPAAVFLLPWPKSALVRVLIAVALGWVTSVLYAGLVVNPVGIAAGHAAGEHFPESRYDNNTIASAIVGGWLAPLFAIGIVAGVRRMFFRKAASIEERTPNNSLERTRER
jgi:hypothetical protein